MPPQQQQRIGPDGKVIPEGFDVYRLGTTTFLGPIGMSTEEIQTAARIKAGQVDPNAPQVVEPEPAGMVSRFFGGADAVTGLSGLKEAAVGFGRALFPTPAERARLERESTGFNVAGAPGMLVQQVGGGIVRGMREGAQNVGPALAGGHPVDAAVEALRVAAPVGAVIGAIPSGGLSIPAAMAVAGSGEVANVVRNKLDEEDFAGALGATTVGAVDVLGSRLSAARKGRTSPGANLLRSRGIEVQPKAGFVRQLLERTIGGKPVFDKALRTENRNFLVTVLDETVNDISSTRAPRSVVGPRIQKALIDAHETAYKLYDGEFNHLRAHPNASVPLVASTELKTLATEIMNDINSQVGAGAAEGLFVQQRKIVQGVLDGFGTLSYNELQRLRTNMRNISGGAEAGLRGASEAVGAQFVKVANELMEDAAMKTGGQGFLDDVLDLNSRYSKYKRDFELELFDKIMTTGRPSQVTDLIRAADGTHVQEYVNFMEIHDPVTLQVARGRVVEDMLLNSTKGSDVRRGFGPNSALSEAVVLGKKTRFSGTSDRGVRSGKLQRELDLFDDSEGLTNFLGQETVDGLRDLIEASELIGPTQGGTAGLVAGAFNSAVVIGAPTAVLSARPGLAAGLVGLVPFGGLAAMAMTDPNVIRATSLAIRTLGRNDVRAIAFATSRLNATLKEWAKGNGISFADLAREQEGGGLPNTEPFSLPGALQAQFQLAPPNAAARQGFPQAIPAGPPLLREQEDPPSEQF